VFGPLGAYGLQRVSIIGFIGTSEDSAVVANAQGVGTKKDRFA
jgi:hypothetical protein